jgi:hypothetical protein
MRVPILYSSDNDVVTWHLSDERGLRTACGRSQSQLRSDSYFTTGAFVDVNCASCRRTKAYKRHWDLRGDD